MIKYLKRNNKGITLMELVITVSVMLILIGVTVNVVLGDNGFLRRTRQAKANEIAAEQNAQEKINEINSEKTITNDGVKVQTDTQAPTINSIKITNIKTSSFQVSVDVTETGSGLKKIEYSIDNGTTWYPSTADSNVAVMYEYKFYGLNAGIEYTVTVKATDNAGNATSATEIATTFL